MKLDENSKFIIIFSVLTAIVLFFETSQHGIDGIYNFISVVTISCAIGYLITKWINN